MDERNMQQDFATVATYSHALDAHAARNYLEANGIRAFIADEYTAGEGWPTFIDAKLQVVGADAERARELLSAARPGFRGAL